MKKISSFVLAGFILFAPVLAFAVAPTHNEQDYYGRKTNLTKYNVGACVNNEGGLWQQLSDGTWAPPNDVLNTCRSQGLYQNWTNNPQTNPWMKTGLDYAFPSYQRNTGYYPYGTNYPGPNGGYSNYNDWYYRCVLLQSIIIDPNCQSFQTIGNATSFSINLGSGSSNNFGKTVVALLAGYTLASLFAK